MAHGHLKEIEAETHKSSWLLVGTLMGGMLVFSSFIVELPWVAATLFQLGAGAGAKGLSSNPYSELIALSGALLLGAPLVWHALKGLVHGHTHMEELVALAVVAAIALGEYQEAVDDLRAYLEAEPDSPEADAVQQLIDRVQRRMAE